MVMIRGSKFKKGRQGVWVASGGGRNVNATNDNILLCFLYRQSSPRLVNQGFGGFRLLPTFLLCFCKNCCFCSVGYVQVTNLYFLVNLSFLVGLSVLVDLTIFDKLTILDISTIFVKLTIFDRFACLCSSVAIILWYALIICFC